MVPSPLACPSETGLVQQFIEIEESRERPAWRSFGDVLGFKSY